MVTKEQETKPLERLIINPWKWQEAVGFCQAVEVRYGEKVLYCSGQASVDGEGRPVNAENMRAQISTALDNLEVVLKEAGYGIPDLVRVNIYTTNVDECLKNFDVIITRLTNAGGRYSCSLFGVDRLAWSEAMVEIEATASK